MHREPEGVRALRGALESLAGTAAPYPIIEARDGTWERYGIPSHALQAEEYERTRAYVVRRVQRLLTAPARAA